MDVLELNTFGESGLISSIIYQAIQDGKAKKTPPKPDLNKQKYITYINLINFLNSMMKYLICDNKISTKIKNMYFQIILNEIEFEEKKVKKYTESLLCTKTKYTAYYSRQFLKSNNELFCHYCNLLGFDPIYLEEKISIYFENFDKGKYDELQTAHSTQNVAQTSQNPMGQFNLGTEKTI